MLLPLLLYLLAPVPETPPRPRNVTSFTNRDVRRYEGQVVYFVGEVGERWGIGDIYAVDLRTAGPSGYHWHALVSKEKWFQLEPGQAVAFQGVLRTHEVDGEWFAVLWGAE
jgi:hypothetical protein